MRHAPVVTSMVWYGVGSRDEGPGQTGLSHFLEHMMFKGTPRFPYGVLEEGVKRHGGMWNTFTSYDYTAYYEVLPAQHLEFSFEVEADRMAGMTFDPDLTVRERGIIVSEREGSENHPSFWLSEAFMATAFQVLPYRHAIIGSKADIRATTAEALAAHSRRYYRPDNASLVVVGDVETERVLRLAERHFGPLPPGGHLQPVHGGGARAGGRTARDRQSAGPASDSARGVPDPGGGASGPSGPDAAGHAALRQPCRRRCGDGPLQQAAPAAHRPGLAVTALVYVRAFQITRGSLCCRPRPRPP